MMTETVHMLDPESGESLLSIALEDASTDKTVLATDGYDEKNADVQKFVDDFLNAQYNALVTSDHTGMKSFFSDNNATNYNNYSGVIYTQHQRPGKGSIQDKINTYGSDLKIRRLSFIAAYF